MQAFSGNGTLCTKLTTVLSRLIARCTAVGGVEQLAAVASKHHAEILEILRRQLRQRVPIDFIIEERLLVTRLSQLEA